MAHATVLFASIEQTKNPEQRKPLPGIGITYPTYLITYRLFSLSIEANRAYISTIANCVNSHFESFFVFPLQSSLNNPFFSRITVQAKSRFSLKASIYKLLRSIPYSSTNPLNIIAVNQTSPRFSTLYLRPDCESWLKNRL